VAGIANEGIRLQVEDQHHEQAMRILEEGLDAPPPPASSEPAAEEGGMPVGLFVAAVAAYAMLGFAIYQAREDARTRPRRTETQTEAYDYNADGKPDHFYTYRQGAIIRGEADRNFDGKIDEWQTFDQAGRPAQVEEDDNFDGRPDFWYFYENGLLVRSEQDTDYDGKPDWFNVYKYGVLENSECRPNGAQIVQRRLLYVNGALSEEWVDEDQDGRFDYKILHDPFGKISERIPVEQGK
jgi:hypothetical protein